MNNTDILIKKLADTISSLPSRKPSAYDTQAEVRRIDGNIAWVHIPGGVDETPVQLTTNAKKGDVVQVRISGGRAWITGNATAPPTDDTKAISAEKKAIVADEHAIDAIFSASIAKDAADSAQASAIAASTAAQAASTAAGIAEGKADDASTAAGIAEGKAGEASRDANIAFRAASTAQWQLAAIEDVVGTLEWIATHAIYRTTDDISVTAGKWYYNITATEVTEPKTYEVQSGKYYTRDTTYRYFVVVEPDVADIGTYYEYDSETETYFLTEDQTIDPEKTYYTRTAYYIYISANTIITGTTYYTVVASAATLASNANPYQLVLYEIDSYDKTVQNYISTHLALDEGGLHLTDGSLNRIDISQTNGVTLYNGGVAVAQYGANTLIGKEDGFHIRITPTKLSFETATNTEVAYMTGEVLNIPRVVVVDSLQIGNWMWDGNNDPTHLTLRWIGA